MRKSALSPDPTRDAPDGFGEYQSPNAWVLLPGRATVDTRLHKYPSTFSVLAFCSSHAKKYTGIFWMNQRTVASALNITQSAVSQHMKKLIEYGYIEKIRKEDRRRAYGKKGAVWRVIYDPRDTLQDVLNKVPKTEEEVTAEAQKTQELANRGAKGQLTKGRKQPVDNSDKTLAPANNNAQSDDNKYKLQLMSKDKPQLMHNYSIELKDKNSRNGFVEEKKKKEKHVRNEHQPERACRAICAAYAAVFQEATGIRWQYDDRQVSIAAAVLNLGYTEDTFIADATATAEWFIGQDKKPPVSLAWFTRKAENKAGHKPPGPDINAILGKATSAVRW
ncbi:winged helix-turn-helix domain-containing protein [Paracoccaceae bacterium]|nr:winged helix-turn-helix domain-containing protein [Paracoccaceae bacterium]